MERLLARIGLSVYGGEPPVRLTKVRPTDESRVARRVFVAMA
jgi:hypothetical protein